MNYVEEDLNNIIWKMEKLEDDLNMKIGSRSDLLKETNNLVTFMKKTVCKYYPEKGSMEMVEDELSLQEIEMKMKEIKISLRETSSGSKKYLELISKLEDLEKKRKILENSEDAYNEGNSYMQEEWVMGELWKF